MTARQRALDALATLIGVALIIITLGWLGGLLDEPTRGYRATSDVDLVSRAVAESQTADQRQCTDLHGPNAVAVQLPDGSHRCTDKHGRRLARSVITIPSHEYARVTR